jgi:hypothetical protein
LAPIPSGAELVEPPLQEASKKMANAAITVCTVFLIGGFPPRLLQDHCVTGPGVAWIYYNGRYIRAAFSLPQS